MAHYGRIDPVILPRRQSTRRRWRAEWRRTWVLAREFRQGLLLFTLTLLLGGLTFQLLWNQSHLPEPITYVEALYDVLTMTFFQPVLDFPKEWYLDIYFFVMPILGIAALALGASDFVALLFNRSLQQSQWEVAVASTFNDHIIICGLGHLGIRVVRELVALDEDIVVVEQDADSPRFDEVRSYDIPIVVGDARTEEILHQAGLERADAIIVCTNNDLINLQIASRVREHNKTIRLVMRMFDDQFARSMADRFDIGAVFSASLLAAPAFAGAATGTEIIQTFSVQDKTLAMGRIEVKDGSRLEGTPVSEVEQELDLSIVLLQSGDAVDVTPPQERVLHTGDIIAVVATLPRIKELATRWNRHRSH